VDHLIPHPRYPLPRDIDVLRPEVFRDVLNSLSDNFQIADNRVLRFRILQEVFLAACRVIEDSI